jgi:hypothetical protein
MTDAAFVESESSRLCIYRIDAADYIRYVNPAWVQFAGDNHGKHLIDQVLGTPLWRHIGGPEVRGIYRVFLQCLRQGQPTIQFPFRCDSPTMRRTMEMELTALPNDGIEFRCRLVREKPRSTVRLLDPASSRSDKRVVLCAWCKRVHDRGEWLELEEAVQTWSLFDGPHSPYMDNDICPNCREMLQDRVKGVQ